MSRIEFIERGPFGLREARRGALPGYVRALAILAVPLTLAVLAVQAAASLTRREEAS
jgi:hypothetical protein